MTLPTALAAPVEAGMMFWLAPRPSLHNLPEGPSTVFWVAVIAWTVLWWKESEEKRDAYIWFNTPPTPSPHSNDVGILGFWSSGFQDYLASLRQIAPRSVFILTIKPSTIPKLSWMTLARGARQLVVHEALLLRSKCARSVDWGFSK